MKRVREPITVAWIWAVLAAIVLLSIPWYLPQGTIYPIILGFPYWAFISVVMSVVLAVFLGYVINNWWDMHALIESESDDKEGGSR